MQLKTTSKALFLPMIVCLVAYLVACGSSGKNASQNAQIAPPAKQVLHLPRSGDFDSLDPALTTDGQGDPYNLIYSGLVTLKDDGTAAKQLATSYQISPDGLTYTFTLRSGLKFSDGMPLDANDVAYSLNRVLLPETQSTMTGYLGLLKDYDKVTSGQIPTLIGDSIIVKDPLTISLVISKPAAYFLEALTYTTGCVVERKLIEKYGKGWTDHLEEGGGNGPFKVQSYGHTAGLVLVPNPNYYEFQPKLQKITYTFISSPDSLYKAYQAGQYDDAIVPTGQFSLAKTRPDYHQSTSLVTQFLGLNYLAKPFDNIKIRQALALAINKDLIVERVLGSNGVSTNHIVPNGVPGYNPHLVGPDGVTSTAGDQTKAQQLFQQGLQEEGYSNVSQLPSFSLEYDNYFRDVATSIVAQWKSVLGITITTGGVRYEQLLADTFSTIGSATPLQLSCLTWYPDYPDPQDWLSKFFAKGGVNNFVNYGQNSSSAATEQQAVQAKLLQADGDQNQPERLKLYQDAEQKIVNDVGLIPLYQIVFAEVANPKLHSWNRNPLGIFATDDWANIYFVQ